MQPHQVHVCGYALCYTPSRLCRQFRLLLRRSWRQITRDKAAAMARLSSNMSSAVIFGAIFFRMQKKQSNIQDRMGLLQVCCQWPCLLFP